MKSNLTTSVTLATAAIALGACAAVASSLAYGPFNSAMDDADKSKARQAVIEDMPASWKGVSGANYSVTPTRTYESSSGPCRDYTITGTVNGKQEKFSSQACKRGDGGWYSGA